MRILAINNGSSSLKLWYANVQPPLAAEAPPPDWKVNLQALGSAVVDAIHTLNRPIDVVGHRIVHAGAFRDAAILTPEIRDAIARHVEFAPAHNRFALEGIDAITSVIPKDTPQVVVFDTGFHKTIEPHAYTYAGPHQWIDLGIRRYGFHGTNHSYVSRRAASMLGRPLADLRLISMHLGNGASLAAVRNGRCVDTTMGLTPLDGVMMGTRSGTIDPGVLIYLMRHHGLTADDLDRILNRESGLAGLSGVSRDMREVLKAVDAGNPRAQLAFDVYVHRLAQETGSMLSDLNGVDALIFTAGVGENTPLLRQRLCARFEFLGLQLDHDANWTGTGDRDITTPGSRVRVLVIGAGEEWEIARECCRLLA